ncbi:hypothetical protein F444_01552 [Phytophthora nicotianae P1976]|uniref:Retrovirus-related Pol polyprotein from transposon TNT 1-94-like beta-barrel domain-containing protein n=1 Tax=Phytophthora nicotianae P1976 TaxID=1317066 RepID=A0A081B094_PHYNI|nr:hypothetical protein F444_01552 [Phytophthora nicotianae P1976]
MPKPTTDASWEVEVSEKTGRPIRWNGQNFQYYKKLMDTEEGSRLIKYDENFTSLQMSAWEGWQLDLQELIFSSVCTDMGQQLMDMKDRSAMWKYLYNRYEGSANDQTKAMTKSSCTRSWSLPSASRTGKHKTVGMSVDDAVFSGMLVASLPSNERLDRLGGFADAGMDCVATPDKVVSMAVTFDKANQIDEQLHRSFGAKQSSGQQNKGGGEGHGKGGHEKTSSKGQGQGKSRSCFVRGSTDHLKGNCTLRRNGNTSPVVALNGEQLTTEGVVTSMAMPRQQEEPHGDESGDGRENEVEEEHRKLGGQEGAHTRGSWWYLDTEANSHVTGLRSRFVPFTEGTEVARIVRGLSPHIISQIAGMGTMALVNEIDGQEVVMLIDDVFYVPDAEFRLFPSGLAYEQGFEMDYDQDTRSFTISWEGRRVVVANLQEAT